MLEFPDALGLRPTPDRVRETLFNWLQFELAGRRVLDLFAGSGALGFEAASRGAAHVTMVEQQREVARCLQSNVQMLDATQVDLVMQDAITFLDNTPGEPFDLVLLDPPYDSDLLAMSCAALEQRQWLSKHAKIYVETDSHESELDSLVPEHWQCARSGKAGQVRFALYERTQSCQ